MIVGSRVRIERDEKLYRSRGTWPQFRGKTGTVVSINMGEFGVVFGKGRRNPTWFRAHEIRPISPVLPLRPVKPVTPSGSTQEEKISA